MNVFFAGLGRVVVRYRYLVVAAWIVLVVLTTRAFPSLGSEVNNNNSQFLPSSAPSSVAANLAAPITGNPNTTSQIVVVAGRNGPITPTDEAALAREITALRRIPRVESARVVAISKDGEAAQIVASVRVQQSDVAAQKTVVEKVLATFPRAAAPPGLELHIAGDIATNVANQQSSNKTGSKTQSFSFLLIIVLLLLIFRSLLAPIVTLVPSAFALLVSMRLIGELGAHGLKISEITDLLLIVLLIGAGTDYGLFLVFRVREEVRGGLSPHDAVRHALVRVGESISASAGTVIFALLSLLLATFGIYRDLGIPLAVGVAVMLVAGLTLLPALLAICGRALFWPSNVSRETPARTATWSRVAARLVARPALTLGIGVALFGGLATAALGYHSGGFGGALNAPAGSDAAAGNALVSRHFRATNSNPADLVLRYGAPVWEHPETLVTAERALLSSGHFTRMTGPLNPSGLALTPAQYTSLHSTLGDAKALPPIEPAGVHVPAGLYDAYRATAAYVSPDGRTVAFAAALRAGPQQSTAAMQVTPQIRADVSRVAARTGATASGVAGEAAALYDVSSTSNSDLVHIVPVAIIAIAILLALVLRSAVAPLYLIISVALSYLAALGVSTIAFLDIGGQKGLTFILPFLMFIFLLALGEDYNILVMTRIREEAHRYPLREAVVRAVAASGPTVTAAGVVLAGSFAVLAVTGGSGPGGDQIRAIGFGLAIGILMDTFLVRTLLVPSTVALLGRWNWWPGRVQMDHPAAAAEATPPALAERR